MFNMEPLLTMVKPALLVILKPAAVSGLRLVAQLVRNNISLLDRVTDKQIDEKLDKIFESGMLEMQNSLIDTMSNVEQNIRNAILEQSILSDYQRFDKIVQSLYSCLGEWLHLPSSYKARKEFLRMYKSNRLLDEVSYFHQRLTIEHGLQQKLVDQIATICGNNWQQFEKWNQYICLTLSRACSLHAAYIWLKFVPGDTGLDKLGSAISNAKNLILGDDEMERSRQLARIKKLGIEMDEIVAELRKNLLTVKSSFLFTPCSDKRHRECGALNDQSCCLLGEKIYRFMAINKNKEFEEKNFAEELAKSLRETYVQFEWSVVVYETDKDGPSRRQFHPERQSDIWMQTTGSYRKTSLSLLTIENKTESRGLEFGQFLCYRLKFGKPKRRALVFWTEKETILSNKCLQPLLEQNPSGELLKRLPEKAETDDAQFQQDQTIGQRLENLVKPIGVKLAGMILNKIFVPEDSFDIKQKMEYDWEKSTNNNTNKELLFLISEGFGSLQKDFANVDGLEFPLDLSCQCERTASNLLTLAWFV